MSTDRSAQRELDLMQAEASVSPEARRGIQKDTIGMIVAIVAFVVIAKLVFG